MVSTAAFGVRSDEYAAVAAHGEAITDSRLFDGPEWPEADPRRGAADIVRELDDELRDLVRECAVTPRFSWSRFLARHSADDTTERLLALLNHRAFQFNSRAAFGGRDSPWRRRLAACVAEGRPVEVVIPAFCVIGNPVKRFDTHRATAAEDVALLHLARIARLIGGLHEPGAVFHIVSDSTFYSPSMGVTSIEALNYVIELRDRIDALGLGGHLVLHDMTDLLQPTADLFQRRFELWFARLRRDPLADGLGADEHARWVSSMVASLDIGKLGLDFAELRATFAEQAGMHAPLLARAEWALAEYRAGKLAATDLEWEERAFPGAIRATIHTKPIPVLGLRLFPEFKCSAKLLPYHGIGVVDRSSRTGEHRMGVRPEMFVHGRPDMRRIVDNRGVTSFYLHTPE